MRRIPTTTLMILSLCCSLPLPAEQTPQQAKAELATLSQQLAVFSRCFNLVHEVVAPSVVSIKTSEDVQNPFTSRSVTMDVGEGSGFVVYADAKSSFILTNAHVVLQTNNDQEFIRGRNNQAVGYDHLMVELNDNRDVDAEYVGFDLSTDLAVIKVAVASLPAVDWGDSDKSRVGDWVLALGYPLGVGYSATSGIVSATDRSTGIYRSIHGLESFIQTDAPINPGNSGGPLVGLDGHIIGVNSNILSRTGVNIGIGFAIPSNLARRVADDLIRFGHVRWPGIGVDLDELSAEAARDLGLPAVPAVQIKHVLASSPAATTGLKPGDVVLAINQSRIRSLMNFRARVACCRIGEVMSLTIWRAGTQSEQKVTPIDRDEVMKERISDRDVELKSFGLRVGIDDGAGLVVTEVQPGSVAALAAFSVGDRILRDDQSGHELKTLEDAEALTKRHEVVLLVLRDNQFFRVRMHH